MEYIASMSAPDIPQQSGLDLSISMLLQELSISRKHTFADVEMQSVSPWPNNQSNLPLQSPELRTKRLCRQHLQNNEKSPIIPIKDLGEKPEEPSKPAAKDKNQEIPAKDASKKPLKDVKVVNTPAKKNPKQDKPRRINDLFAADLTKALEAAKTRTDDLVSEAEKKAIPVPEDRSQRRIIKAKGKLGSRIHTI